MTPATPSTARQGGEDDPALTGDFSAIWAGHLAENDAKPLESDDAGDTPATRLKKRCREALKPLRELGSRPLWEPRVTAGQVRFGGGDKAYGVGNKGQTDVLVTWFSIAWHVEIKAEGDRERKSQTKYAPWIHKAHGRRITVRQPEDLIDAMMHWYRTHPATVAEVLRDARQPR